MATLELPPRRSRRTQEMTILRNRSSLEILLQMGFPKYRAERALASTGDKGIQLASDWLLLHVNDPTLEEKFPRDYILYLCPVGQLQQEFLDFWQKSYQECGWNRAHNYFPHITLCSFFQAEDSLVSQLSHVIKKVAERVMNAPETVEFDYFSSTNFIGLFITESFALLLKQVTTDFAEEMKKSGVMVEPHKKQLHASLSYQFPTDKKEKLESLAKTINLKAPARWDLRLYSRDKGKANCQVRKVLYTHVPGAADELEMCDGDFIYMNESELESSTDGWYLGTSWMTGCVGMFPGVYTERTAETETWTMHRSIPIVGTDLYMTIEPNGPQSGDNIGISTQILRSGLHSNDQTSVNNLNSNFSESTIQHLLNSPDSSSLVVNLDGSRNDRRLISTPSSSLTVIPESVVVPPSSSDNILSTSALTKSTTATSKQPLSPHPTTQPSANTSHSNATTSSSSSSSGGGGAFPEGRSSSPKHCRIQATDNIISMTTLPAKGPRQLYVVRHGERIDFTFGKDWIQNSFNQSGKYIRYDLNMPKSVPKRKSGPPDFRDDSPLTVQGHFQARLLGEAMHEKDIVIVHVYSSPSLRCVETATSLLEGLNTNLEISVEPGLYEWLGWYQTGIPKFMTSQELQSAGHVINVNHNPIWPFVKYNVQETAEQFYDRCYQVTKEILKRHENEGGSVLIVSHAVNLDTCTRQLVGQPPRSHAGFHEILHKIPYCAMSVAQEATVVRDTWYLIEPPVLPFAHTNNPKYNWTSLTTPNVV